MLYVDGVMSPPSVTQTWGFTYYMKKEKKEEVQKKVKGVLESHEDNLSINPDRVETDDPEKQEVSPSERHLPNSSKIPTCVRDFDCFKAYST